MTAGRKKYVFLINSLSPGGAERSLVELLAPMRDRGIDPVIVCLAEREVGFADEVVAGGFEIRYLRSTGRLGRIRELRRILREERPALLHTTLIDADIIGRLASVGTGIPVITTLANTTYDSARVAADDNVDPTRLRVVREIDAWTGRLRNDHFHAVSQAVKDASVADLRLPADRITVVRRGRDPGRLGRAGAERRSRVRADLGLGTERVVITVGRQEYQKGQSTLLRAFAELAGTRSDLILLIAGREGNATSDLTAEAAELGISARVRFLGHRPDVPDLLAASDLFVFPSLWEGLGGALIEALALEVPTITSDLPATREVVGDDGTSGLVFPAGDAGALAAVMAAILDDPATARRVSSGSRSRFEEMFQLDDRSQAMIDLLESVAR